MSYFGKNTGKNLGSFTSLYVIPFVFFSPEQEWIYESFSERTKKKNGKR